MIDRTRLNPDLFPANRTFSLAIARPSVRAKLGLVPCKGNSVHPSPNFTRTLLGSAEAVRTKQTRTKQNHD